MYSVRRLTRHLCLTHWPLARIPPTNPADPLLGKDTRWRAAPSRRCSYAPLYVPHGDISYEKAMDLIKVSECQHVSSHNKALLAVLSFCPRRPRLPIRPTPKPIRTLWEISGYACTACRSAGDSEWTCPALIEEYNDLLRNPLGTEADVVELDFGEGKKGDTCAVPIFIDRQVTTTA